MTYTVRFQTVKTYDRIVEADSISEAETYLAEQVQEVGTIVPDSEEGTVIFSRKTTAEDKKFLQTW